jgi:RimJ/RimL family protein N-acetyltransferase
MTTESASPFPPEFAISTPRLRIHPFNPDTLSHCEFLVQLWNTDDFINSCGRTGIDTPEKAAAFIRRRVLADYARNRHGQFLISLVGATQAPKLIGCVSLMKGAPPGPHYLAPDIGYTILPEESGKGYATEAAKGLLEYARFELDIHSALGFCAATDLRSRRVLEKIGMDYRGVAALSVFGGKESAVYSLPGMDKDLGVYNLTEDLHDQ